MKNPADGPDDPSVESDVRPAAPQKPAPAPAGTGHLAEGSRFGVYVIGTCIGQGGMARVYRAEHEGLQRQVALKVLIDGVGHDGEAHERFVREARLAAAIKHPNVVNIFDVGVCDGTPYLVMELLEGVDLDALVESKGRLDEETIVDIVVPIVAGLAAVHEAGIVHRDLKPGNIFLARGRNDDLEPKLLDFGISKSTAPDQMKLTSARGMMIGTPFYMAPEAARGAEVTALSDQYALGVVMYECATGVNPFLGANNFGEVIARVSTGSFEPIASRNPDVSKKLAAIIERAMHIDPDRRFPDMRAMGRELLQLAGERTRITWGTNFADLASPSRGVLLDGEAALRDKSKWPSRLPRRWPAAVLALAGAAALGVAVSGKRGTEAAAPRDPAPARASALPLRPPSASESRPSSAAASEPTLAIPISRAVENDADTLTGVSAPARSSPGAKQRDEDAQRESPAAKRRKPRPTSDSAPRREPERKAGRNAPSTSEAPDLAPEWLPAPAAAPKPVFNAGRGTNNAPILD